MSCAAVVIASSAQTFTTLYNFCSQSGCADGAEPLAGLVQGTDGNFYGTASFGGVNGGLVFKITRGGTLTTLHTFCSQLNCADGNAPFAGLVQGSDGNFWGTTNYGGSTDCAVYGCGTIFKITPKGKLTTIYNFCARTNCSDGANPYGGLIQATDGDFYGTTSAGGLKGAGTVFKMTRGGVLTTLYSFCALRGCNDGEQPWAGLVQGTDGNFYGTTKYGGVISNAGTVFKVTPGGILTTLHTFCAQGTCPDGYFPYAGLMQASDGNFYGTTYAGGGGSGAGTIYELTPGGTFSTVYDFCQRPSCDDGSIPFSGLIQATDGYLYGATTEGGAGTYGTIFKISTATGALTTLQNFDSTNGGYPEGALLQATDGNFYGTTDGGGANGYGTVFSLSTDLGLFVKTLSSSGKVGASVIILGNNLTGATSVSFSGTAATFTAKSTEIKTKVPAGATTGTLTVTTPSGIFSSNVAFRVTPQLKSFMPKSGPVGTLVQITGVSLTQTTAVDFGDVATESTVNSDTEVTATVPTDATTGKIMITTLGGTVSSAATFKVTR